MEETKTKKIKFPKFGAKYKYVGLNPMYKTNSIFQIDKIYENRFVMPFKYNNEIKAWMSGRENTNLKITLKGDDSFKKWDFKCFAEEFEEIIKNDIKEKKKTYTFNISEEELEILNKAKEIIERINNNIIR